MISFLEFSTWSNINFILIWFIFWHHESHGALWSTMEWVHFHDVVASPKLWLFCLVLQFFYIQPEATYEKLIWNQAPVTVSQIQRMFLLFATNVKGP